MRKKERERGESDMYLVKQERVRESAKTGERERPRERGGRCPATDGRERDCPSRSPVVVPTLIFRLSPLLTS